MMGSVSGCGLKEAMTPPKGGILVYPTLNSYFANSFGFNQAACIVEPKLSLTQAG